MPLIIFENIYKKTLNNGDKYGITPSIHNNKHNIQYNSYYRFIL